jgi:hypothetical protein
MSSKTRIRNETVKHLTYFVVQTYKAVKGGGISAEDPREARDHDNAIQLFERYKSIRAGVLAFRRTGDPKTGDWEDAIIIRRHGRLPSETDCLVDEADLSFETGELMEADLNVA